MLSQEKGGMSVAREREGRAMRCARLFFSMLTISAFTFGGGFVIVTLMKRKFVDAFGWLDEQEMLDYTTIAQSCPGAIAVNAAIITGALVAFALAVVNVKAESVTIGDNALIYCTSFCAFALLGNLDGYAAEKVLVPAILFTFCLSVLITRVKTVAAYEN